MTKRTPEQSRAIGDFLRARRTVLSPQDMGIFGTLSRRRTPGLRREEAAALCGISTTWYTWLEQGRDVACSAATLARIASVFRFTPAERTYLFALAALKDPFAARPRTAALPDSARALPLLVQAPCYILDDLWTVCAANDAARHLFGPWLDGRDPNLLRFVFLAPEARDFVEHWDSTAWRVLAEFRADSVRADARQVEALVAELCAHSPAFAGLWQRQSVLTREGGPRRFRHPTDGPLAFEQTTLRFSAWPDYRLVTLTPITVTDGRAP
ncbi:putative transcriptional regulator [Ameyamaea chiangmaiensis NBRC 103196]|nr:helix-turn-helix transcriptional regulator [Ameyamaea chiangmaiensis]GBQ72325.1 putative transcriptional regulator [Ameyamaea chiangmaiensis NBRC 103196]